MRSASPTLLAVHADCRTRHLSPRSCCHACCTQRERIESETAALEREEMLEAKVEELEEKDRRRIALEAAMEAAMATEASPATSAASSITVSVPPPTATEAPGFDVSAGGFSL